MVNKKNYKFSKQLQEKIDSIKETNISSCLGQVCVQNPFLFAPLSGVSNPPFRLLMENLGAGATVSELISCHGINYQNKRTINMLKVDPREQNVGIQLFGEDAKSMREAALIAQDFGAKFIDINMGCPVRKVVSKGGGSALLKNVNELPGFLREIKSVLKIPLSIKIRTGWDNNSLVADKVIEIADNEGVEFVTVHGRTKAQNYQGEADWAYLEKLAQSSSIPFVGNGDLSSSKIVYNRYLKTNCDALMVGRGVLKNPFLFLEAAELLREGEKQTVFGVEDCFEVVCALRDYTAEYFDNEHIIATQLKKHIVWFTSGLPGATHFRSVVFKMKKVEDLMRITEDFFLGIAENEEVGNK